MLLYFIWRYTNDYEKGHAEIPIVLTARKGGTRNLSSSAFTCGINESSSHTYQGVNQLLIRRLFWVVNVLVLQRGIGNELNIQKVNLKRR